MLKNWSTQNFANVAIIGATSLNYYYIEFTEST